MNYYDLRQEWSNLRPEAKRAKLLKVFEELSDYIRNTPEEGDFDEIIGTLDSTLEEMESNDCFGTEGMRL